VAKAEWGVKRTCLSCGARFYDLQRESITCPACGAAFDVTALSKPRRARATPVVAKVVAAAPALVEVEAVAVAVEDDVELEAELEDDVEVVEAEAADEEAEEEDGESAIEDVSELGDDDMADVIDTELDEEETNR
jgi:uncharacterized protein (TIGR02300 family)